MNCILDTHTTLWHLSNDSKLPRTAVDIINDPDNSMFVSQASLLEMSIKMSLGKLTLPIQWPDLFYYFERGGWQILSIENRDSILLSQLPFHHADPFDRIMACQCINRRYNLISRDTALDAYGVQRLWG